MTNPTTSQLLKAVKAGIERLIGGALAKREGRIGQKTQGKSWRNYRTPLNRYCSWAVSNFEEYLEKKVNEARSVGRKLNVLDVGMGDGFQWIEFLKKHRDVVEFTGTTLEKAHSELLELENVKVHEMHVGNLYKIRTKFDVVVSNQGIHFQEQIGVNKMYDALKPRGELIIHNDGNLPEIPKDVHVIK